MTKERIEVMRKALIPFVKEKLIEINYEGLGKYDAEEFEKDFNELLNLAIKALEKETVDLSLFADRTTKINEIRKSYKMNEIRESSLFEDAVSKKIVKEKMIRYGFHSQAMTVTEFIEDL